VIGEDGRVLAGPRGEEGEALSTAEVIAAMEGPPDWTKLEERNTTLVCVMTDAALDKAACTRVARMASGGVARAVDPVHSDVDGDVAFCLSSGIGATDRFAPIAIGTIAATVTAAAIRDTVR
jgi:L-aminopeptidase/D-esterase-like protein